MVCVDAGAELVDEPLATVDEESARQTGDCRSERNKIVIDHSEGPGATDPTELAMPVVDSQRSDRGVTTAAFI